MWPGMEVAAGATGFRAQPGSGGVRSRRAGRERGRAGRVATGAASGTTCRCDLREVVARMQIVIEAPPVAPVSPLIFRVL